MNIEQEKSQPDLATLQTRRNYAVLLHNSLHQQDSLRPVLYRFVVAIDAQIFDLENVKERLEIKRNQRSSAIDMLGASG